MSTLICLGGGIEGLPILERAKALGHRLVVVDGNPQAPGFNLSGDTIIASCYDAEATLRRLGMDGHPKYDGVICCAIDAPHVAAAVTAEFGLPGLTPAQAHLSVDKLAQKKALKTAGLPVPPFYEQLPNGPWYAPVGGMVVKPADSRGARGVLLATEFDALTRLDQARRDSPTGRAYIESFVSGPQLSTESIIQDGRVLFTAIGLRNYDRLAEFAPYIIEDGYDMPYTVPDTAGADLLHYGVNNRLEQACAALGWNNLTVKGDWIIHDGKLIILELAARLSGGFFGTPGIPLAYNYPFVDVAIELALGGGQALVDMSSVPTRPERFVSQRYVFPEPGDIGKRFVDLVSGIEVDCEFATYAIHPGDVIAPVVSHGQRWGQATCTGATPEIARKRAERAVAAMKAAVVLEPARGATQ